MVIVPLKHETMDRGMVTVPLNYEVMNRGTVIVPAFTGKR